ncbi:ExbD/TolR family protein [Roseateles chitinivorans]|uniref:ExbD/TolR family protein n=1 Tax=Roseateles chitinivorans TaxID=2917965 RepID=UPI003D668BA6
MKFRRRQGEEPEINLIPFIDVLLVVLIFLMLSTTYSKFTELQLTLPTADAQQMKERPAEIIVAISADGRYSIDSNAVEGRSVDLLTAAMLQSAQGKQEPVVIISADAATPHQAVVNAMDAARRANLTRLTFAANKPQ